MKIINEKIKEYFEICYTVIVRPIFFYTTMPSGGWKENSLTFASISSWILSFGFSVMVFVTQYIPIGQYLIEGLGVKELIIVSPVIVAIALVFFAMTFVIIGGIVMGLILSLLFATAALEHRILKLIGGKGDFNEMVKAHFYSSAVFLIGLFPALFGIFTKWHLLSFWQFQMSENIVYYFACVYIYGIWSIAGKKIHDVPRWKAFIAAAPPALVLAAINIVISGKILPRIENLFI